MGTHHNLTQDSHRLRWDSRHAALRCYHYGVSKESEGGWLLKPGAKEVIQGHGKEVYDKEVKTRRLEYKCTKIFNFYLDLGFWIGWFTFADLMTAGAQHEWRHRDVSSSEGRPILPSVQDWEILCIAPFNQSLSPSHREGLVCLYTNSVSREGSASSRQAQYEKDKNKDIRLKPGEELAPMDQKLAQDSR